MPLTDLINNLNSRCRPALPGLHSTTPFVAVQGRVFVHYADLRLESCFLPFIETTSGRVLGHAAELVATGLGTRRQLDPGAVFALPTDAGELVYLDRLVRTLHALNYLTHGSQGNLILKVHPRHVASVQEDHGLAFEEILRPCGLVPEQITLKIDTQGIEDMQHLKRAVANYKARGYGIAINRFGCNGLDFDLLQEIRPLIVELDPSLLASGRPLHRLVGRLHDLKILIMAQDSPGGGLREGAVRAHIDLLQARRGVPGSVGMAFRFQGRSAA